MSDRWENSTVEADLRSLVPSVAFLELRVRGSYGSRELPLLDSSLCFRLHESKEAAAEWSVTLSDDFRLVFRCRTRELEPIIRLVGEELVLGNERLMVVDLRTLPPYRLVGLSAELGYRIWPLLDGVSTVGRPGRRNNSIVLGESSISRAHARFEIQDKTARLISESDGALTAVNGQRLEVDRACDLQPNDVLQFGDLLFRWEREERAFVQVVARPRLRALGRCAVSLGSARQDELEFRNENARILLFHLASFRDSDLAIERLLEGYWPERPALRQRKNLSHSLKALQGELGWSDSAFSAWLPRSAETLRLDSAAIESFDVWTLRDALRRFDRQAGALRELVGLHPGPFLPQCSMGWARSLRTELFVAWLQALTQCAPCPSEHPALGETLTRCLRDGDFEEFVYEAAFQVAARFSLGHLIRPWLQEFEERLLSSTGDLPSSDLKSSASRFSPLIGTGSDAGALG